MRVGFYADKKGHLTRRKTGKPLSGPETLIKQQSASTTYCENAWHSLILIAKPTALHVVLMGPEIPPPCGTVT